MMLMVLQMTISVLFAMSLFHKIYKRSVSTFLVILIGFLWVFLSSLGYDSIGLGMLSGGLLFIYFRAMRKSDTDKVL